MLLNVKRVFGWTIAGLAMGSVAEAAETTAGVAVPAVAVTTGALSTHLGGELRTEAIYSDHGVRKHPGYKPDNTTTLGVTNANLLLGGNINANTEYALRFNLLNPKTTPLDYGYGVHWFTKEFGFSIGKERILQGGWDHMDQGYRTHVEGFYAQNLALNDFDPMLALHLKVAGLISLQVVNDVRVDAASTSAEARGRWNRDPHPTVVFGWLGEFGPIRPLVDFGSYDNNKSRWVDVGLKTQLNGLHATLDYHNDSVSYRRPVAGTTDKKESDNKQAWTVNVSYTIENTITPWLYYSYYDNKESTDGATGQSDRKVNTATPSAAEPGGYTYAWDDNGTAWGAGLDFDTFGKNWNPFIAFVSQNGKFPKSTNPADKERRTENTLKIGILGQI